MLATDDTRQSKTGSIFKKDKEVYQCIEQTLKELGQQFKEQSKCLDDRANTQMAVLEMAHDFLKKWADLENDHSQKLEKLIKSFANKEKSGNNGNISTSVCLLGLFSTCGKLGKMYQQMAEMISSQVTERLQNAREETQQIRKQCVPVLEQCQENVKRTVQEILTTIKPYNSASNSFHSADQQFRDAKSESGKYSGQVGEQKQQLKKQASVERKVAERHTKREQLLSKLNEERNRHIMSIATANATMACYNTDLLPKYIRAMDYCARPALCLTLQTISKFMSEAAERSFNGAGEELKSVVTRCQAENDVALMSHYNPKAFGICTSRQINFAIRFSPLRNDEVIQPFFILQYINF